MCIALQPDSEKNTCSFNDSLKLIIVSYWKVLNWEHKDTRHDSKYCYMFDNLCGNKNDTLP